MEHKLILSRKISKKKSIILFFLILLFYVLENYLSNTNKNSSLYILLLKAAFWSAIAIFIIASPKIKCHGKIRKKNSIIWWTTLLASFYVMLMVFGGLIVGFGKSPYAHSMLGALTNILTVYTVILGREYARHYLMNNNYSKKYFTLIAKTALLMTIVNFPIKYVFFLDTKLNILNFIGNEFLPCLFDNVLACYLVYLGGPFVSIIYFGIKEGFMWFSPVLPNFTWITTSFINILFPFFILVIINYIYQDRIDKIATKKDKMENPTGVMITMVLSILLLWFAVGVFPLRPMVIATGSMEPVIKKGDVVIVKRSDSKDMKIGDIVQYQSENIYIFHRIIDIEKERNETKFKTKGDNNSIPDPDLVNEDKIKGKVLYVVPKIGWPTLLLKGRNSIDNKKVQF